VYQSQAALKTWEYVEFLIFLGLTYFYFVFFNSLNNHMMTVVSFLLKFNQFYPHGLDESSTIPSIISSNIFFISKFSSARSSSFCVISNYFQLNRRFLVHNFILILKIANDFIEITSWNFS
jgi:hypothetical protein